MNKKIQGIIIGGVVVVALGGTLAFLELTGKDPKDGSQADSSTASVYVDPDKDPVAIISTEPANIKEVRVKNELGEYVLERPASGKSEFNIKELVGINQNVYMKETTVEELAKLEAYKLVEENASDLEKYGLTEPRATFTIVFGDGKETTYLVGKDDLTKERYCYFCEEGKTDVYMVLKTRMSGVFSSKESYASTTLIPSEAANSGDYGKLTVKRKDLGYDMVFEDASSDKASLVAAQVMSEPIYASLNITTSTKVTHGFSGLTAASCVLVNPKDEDFAAYGLDDPHTEVIYEENGTVYDLKIGTPIYVKNENDEDTDEIEAYYCYVTGYAGTDCIWTVSAETAIWATFMPGDVIAMMTANKIYDLSELKITGDGISYDFTLSADGGSKIDWVRKNGELMDDDPFRSLYLFILSLPTSDIYFEEIKGDPFVAVDIVRADGEGDKLEFFKDTERRVLVKVNGRPSYRIESRWTDELINNLGRIDRGEPVKEKA